MLKNKLKNSRSFRPFVNKSCTLYRNNLICAASPGWQRQVLVVVVQWVIEHVFDRKTSPGNPYGTGRISTVDLLVLTSLGKLHLILQTLFTFLQNKLL